MTDVFSRYVIFWGFGKVIPPKTQVCVWKPVGVREKLAILFFFWGGEIGLGLCLRLLGQLLGSTTWSQVGFHLTNLAQSTRELRITWMLKKHGGLPYSSPRFPIHVILVENLSSWVVRVDLLVLKLVISSYADNHGRFSSTKDRVRYKWLVNYPP